MVGGCPQADPVRKLGATQKPISLHCRVKTALAKKEEAVNSLRKQHEVSPLWACEGFAWGGGASGA